MTTATWARLLSDMCHYWPQSPIAPATGNVWGEVLADLPDQAVAAAVKSFMAEGREFPPNGGHIRARAVELMTSDDDRSWAEVWHEIQANIAYFGVYREPAEADWTTPLVAELVRLVGWEEICTTTAEPTVFEAQCRKKFGELLARKRSDQVVGSLPATRFARRVDGVENPSLTGPHGLAPGVNLVARGMTLGDGRRR